MRLAVLDAPDQDRTSPDGGLDGAGRFVGGGLDLIGDLAGEGLSGLGDLGVGDEGAAAGGFVNDVFDFAGSGVSTLADLAGDGAQILGEGAGDVANWALDTAGDGIEIAADVGGDLVNGRSTSPATGPRSSATWWARGSLPQATSATRSSTPRARWSAAASGQACLLRATEVRVRLHLPTPSRVRQLLRWAKFHQLVHHAERDGDDLVLVLDGPTSLFSQSTRYGLQLANFFPAVLLQQGTWSVEATVVWTKARLRKTLRIGHDAGLVSHLPDTGAYQTRAHQWFEERWAAHDSPWTMHDDTVPIDLGGQAVVMPDYRFEHADGRVGRLELLGFWTRERLARHLELLERYGPGDVIVAVSRRLRAEKALGELPPHVLEFAEVLAPARVVATLEATAR